MISLNNLLEKKESGEIYRLGATFFTDKNSYFYDTGTGKAVKLDEESSPFIKALFDENVDTLQLKNIANKSNNIDDIIDFLNKENLLCNKKVTQFISLENYYKEENLQMEQLIIELTGKCNLRCKYCIYNDYNDGNRNFNLKEMEFETARKAIDYIYSHHHSKRLSITFYGGEPLLNFDVMKACIDYSLEHLKECNLSFSFTTNLTLMTEEIADYLARVPELSIVLSLDGPEEVQNSARVYVDNRPTFKDAFKGLKILAKAINKYKKTNVTFNSVLLPPYTVEHFEEINNFFESLDFMPEGTGVQVSYPSPNTVPQSYIDKLKSEGYTDEQLNGGWFEWAKGKILNSDFIENRRNLYSGILEASLTKIHNRILWDKPLNINFYNGCCIPGQRRLYLCTDGSYKVCERIGNSPNIGNVDSGLDKEAIKKYYLNKYEEKSIKDCSSCWAIHLCDLCYSDSYDEDGINIDKKRIRCKAVKDRYKSWLSYYYYVLENYPERIEEISKLEIS